MNAPANPVLARALTDEADRLVEADEPLLGFQLACGGELPGTIAIPELLLLVRKARAYGLRLARAVAAQDGEDAITAWVEVKPLPEGTGCRLEVLEWRTTALVPDSDAEAEDRAIEIDRSTAELTARLDPQQNIVSAEASASDLAELATAMQAGEGKRWTDFVDMAETQHAQPLHWRLLDGAALSVAGSERQWTARLVPLGRPEPGSQGFELYLVADRLLPTGRASVAPQVSEKRPIGRDLTPVLRQPIARIIANAETIRTKLAGPLAAEYSEYAADIATAGQHLLGLLEDLADLEVVEADEFETAPDRIDLGDAARRAAGILQVRAQDRGIEIVAPQVGESITATAEFRRVLQILLNLVGNAIRYSPEQSQVWIRIERDGERTRLIVADQGPGLDEEQQARVFEKFERLGRGGDGGSGLGLYISRKLARAMGGDIAIDSAAGQGARFIVDLPGA